jgi:hypothetical protein
LFCARGRADAGFERVGVGQWFLYVTGATEVVAGFIVPKVAPWAAAALAVTTVGAIGTHL